MLKTFGGNLFCNFFKEFGTAINMSVFLITMLKLCREIFSNNDYGPNKTVMLHRN